MTAPDFSTTILVDQSPTAAFNAINNPRGWWSEEIEGETDKLDEEFTYHFEDLHYCQLKLIQVIPDKKIEWLVKYNYFKHTKDRSEWTGTKVCFDIDERNNKTELHFTHRGLTPEFECFSVCSNGWNQYIRQSLASLIKTGVGFPNATGTPRTEDEVRMRSLQETITR